MPAFPKPNPTETDPVAGPNLTTHAALTTTAHGGIVASNDARLTDGRVDSTARASAATAQSTADGAVVLAGTKALPTKAWATATAYLAGQMVTNGGHTYTANDAHTSGATFAGDLATHWTLLPIAYGDVGAAAASHASQHKTGGTDAIKLDELAAPTDVTTLNADTSKHGLLPKLDGSTSKYLRADGTWQTITVPDTAWIVQVPIGVASEAVKTGTWSREISGSYSTYSGYSNTGAVNDALAWDVMLGAGTWKLSVLYAKNTNHGIITVALDGTTIGTIDGYASLSYNNLTDIAGISVAATAKVRLSLTLATKNASASSYVSRIQAVTFQRTA